MYKDSICNKNFVSLISMAEQIAQSCDGCNRCQKECTFLQTHGNPGTIAKKYVKAPDQLYATSFECSLCGLCTSVCPGQLDPSAMFLEFRQQAVEKGYGQFSEHQRLVNYENKGRSKKYSLYVLPTTCDTIFFPGCSLPGTRPDVTLKTYEYLKTVIKNIGIVLDCCTKPSHDLGRQDDFERMFFELKACLLENEITTIIVACPSCHDIFKTHAPEFKVETVYDIMAQNKIDHRLRLSVDVTIHDPCSARFETTIQKSVRSMVQARGLDIVETDHTKQKTVCCGEGGAVGCLSPTLAEDWAHKRAQEASSHKIATYCAGCVNLLAKKADTFHVLDLFFDPERTMAGKAKISKAPFTYLNRLKLKKRLKQKSIKIMQERSLTTS